MTTNTLQFRNYKGEMVDAPQPSGTLIQSTDNGLIRLFFDAETLSFTVTYGLQVSTMLDIHAASRELSTCIGHDAECNADSL